jgi:hypothetical protein
VGPVTDLVAPSVFHDLFIPQWLEAYPQARLHAADGLRREPGDWPITDELTTWAAPTWTDEIDDLVLQGMPRINETVFVHKPSRTLIVADLVFNYTDCQMNTATSLTLRRRGPSRNSVHRGCSACSSRTAEPCGLHSIRY